MTVGQAVSIRWLQSEIDESLAVARYALEEFAEGSGRSESVRQCMQALHTVRGAFEMLEVYGPTLIIDEMRTTCDALANQQVRDREEACEALMRGVVQLPDYVEYLASGSEDAPTLMLPLLNDLRSVRGEHLLSESALFGPDLRAPIPQLPNGKIPNDAMLQSELRKLVPFFRRGLDGLLSDSDPKDGVGLLSAVLFKVSTLVGDSSIRRLWWVGVALASAVRDGGVEASVSVKRLFAHLGDQLEQLEADGSAALHREPPDNLLKNLLFYVAYSASESKPVQAVREAFHLDNCVLRSEQRVAAERRLTGPSLEALGSVSDALKENIATVKDALDTFVRNEDAPTADLAPLSDTLEQVADTLGLLALGESRRILLDQAAAIRVFRRSPGAPRHDELMSIASALLNVDGVLDSIAERGLEPYAVMEEEGVGEVTRESGDTQLTPIEYLQLLKLVVAEARADLSAVKDAIGLSLSEHADRERLADVPVLLKQVEGCLAILSLDDAKGLLAQWRDFVMQTLIDGRWIPPQSTLEVLADTIVGFEYYLEAVVDAQFDADRLLGSAQKGVQRLSEALEQAKSEEPDLFSGPTRGRRAETSAPERRVAEFGDDGLPESEGLDVPGDELADTLIAPEDEGSAFDPGLVPENSELHAPDGAPIPAVVMEDLLRVKSALDRLEASKERNAQVNESLPMQRDGDTGNSEPVGPIGPIGPIGQADGSDADTLQPVAIDSTLERSSDLQHDQEPQLDEAGVEEARAPVLPDDVDESILEIFLEEAMQVHQTLSETLPLWLADPTDTRALVTVRRAFHTLKGSGRIVGAVVIGDFAYAIESLLNRVIDRVIPSTREVQDLTQLAYHALPALIEELRTGNDSAVDLASIIEDAERMARPGGLTPRPGSVDSRSAGDATDQPDPVAADGGAQILSFPGIEFAEESSASDAADFVEVAARLIDDGAGGGTDTELPPSVVPPSADLGSIVPVQPADDTPGQLPPGDAASDRSRLPLGQIFAEEASGHLEELAGWLATSDDRPIELLENSRGEANAPLLRVFHTLRGSARAAGASDIASLCSALEDWLLELAQPGDSGDGLDVPAPLTAAGVTLIGDAMRAIDTAIRSADFAAPPDGAMHLGAVAEHGALVARAAELRREARTNAERVARDLERARREHLINQMSLSADEGDFESTAFSEADRAELMGVFIEEASEIVEANEAILSRLRERPEELDLVTELQREVHTLKGGAGLASLTPLRDLSHGMESVLTLVADGMLAVNDSMLSALEQAHDRLAQMVEQLRDGVAIEDADDVLELMDTLVSPGLAGIAQLAPTSVTTASADETDGSLTEPLARAASQSPARAPAQPANSASDDKRQRVQVSAHLLDDLFSLAGEISISQSRIERFVGQVGQNLDEMDQTVNRLQDQLRRLELETESQILYRYGNRSDDQRPRQAPNGEHGEFDPLELDRFSNMQELSRGLAESVDDLSSIRALLEDLTRDSEAILVEQSRTNTDLQRGLMQTRMLPFSRQISRFKRVVRQTARELGKRVELEISGEDTQLDRHILNRMLAPIEHMLRNAVDHGIESAPSRTAAGKPAVAAIRLSLARDGAEVVIELSDDGNGMDRVAIRARAIERGLIAPDANLDDDAIMQFALEPAVSTASEITQISGRGVGLDVVNTEVKQLGGSLHIASEGGVGTTFTIRLPFTLAINQALMASVSQETFAIPLINVDAVVRYSAEELEQVAALDTPALTHNAMEYRYVSLAALLGLKSESSGSELERYPVVLLRAGDYRMALLVDELVGRHEVVVKPIGPQLSAIGWIAGASVMPDGKVVLVLDVPTLIRMGMNQERQSLAQIEPVVPHEAQSSAPLVMVVDDSITVRRVTDRFLSRNGMRVVTAKDGLEALSLLQVELPDLMLLDIEMPRMDGFELATTIRNEPHFGHFPIVMITSRTGTKHSERARQIGVDRYLGKPYQESQLLDTINELIGVDA